MNEQINDGCMNVLAVMERSVHALSTQSAGEGILAGELSDAMPVVADLVNALHWALRRIREVPDAGDLYSNAEAALIRAGATINH